MTFNLDIRHWSCLVQVLRSTSKVKLVIGEKSVLYDWKVKVGKKLVTAQTDRVLVKNRSKSNRKQVASVLVALWHADLTFIYNLWCQQFELLIWHFLTSLREVSKSAPHSAPCCGDPGPHNTWFLSPESTSHETCVEKFGELRTMVFEICERRDRQATLIAILRIGGGEITINER